jgi:hypothetical protein
MTAQSPDVPLGVALEHPLGTAADFIDVIDLPGRVMQERHGGRLDQQVVMISGAPHKCRCSPDFVAHLESDAGREEALRGFGVRSADHDMAQFPGPVRFLAQDAWRSIVLSFGAAGPVVGTFTTESCEIRGRTLITARCRYVPRQR